MQKDYVTDCARANICAMQSDTTDVFYNVGNGIKTSIKEIAASLLELTDSNLEIQFKPGGLTFVKNRVGGPRKAQQEIGFKAEKNLRQGLLELSQWRKTHKEEVELQRRKLK